MSALSTPPLTHVTSGPDTPLWACSGIRTTVQFNAKVFSTDPSKPHLWSTTPIEGVDISEDGVSFYANDVAVELSAEGDSYTIKSLADENCIVNLKVTRTCPGVVAGTDGQTHYGTDMSNPWGNMRHRFWPRCRAEGTMTTKEEGPVDFSGRAMFVHAIQGMKPHHAAARWNFVDFQGPTYSAVMMEFTTPPSYGSTVVNVGIVAKDGEIVAAGCSGKATHVTTITGEADEWPAPKTAKFEWVGKTKEGKEVSAIVEGDLGERTDCVDIMSEVPGFVKKIVGGVVGTKPYIYQVCMETCDFFSSLSHLHLACSLNDESDISLFSTRQRGTWTWY